jgi:hypothetical protein
LQEWNRIAPKKSYRRRTLEYNEHGACAAEPSEILEWRDKKGYNHVTIEIYADNGRFYYGYDYLWKGGGSCCGLGIMNTGFPTMQLLRDNVRKKLGRIKGIESIIHKLIPENVQMELF